MKKVVVLTIVAFLVGLAAPALADNAVEERGVYHEVYKYDSVEGWGLTREAEMYSKISASGDYRWESHPLAWPGKIRYMNPTPEPPVQFDIYNYVHLFPWIEAHITETHLTWDIFKPGDYMAKAFILQFQANCPVLVHLGEGTWWIPSYFVGGPQNGHIMPGPFTKKGPDVKIEDKPRKYGLLRDPEGKEKNPAGTPTDAIEVRYWYQIVLGDKPSEWKISPEELKALPPKDQWIPAVGANSRSLIFPDTDMLHEPNKYHVVFYEDLLVEKCDSEGKYLDVFAITITADP